MPKNSSEPMAQSKMNKTRTIILFNHCIGRQHSINFTAVVPIYFRYIFPGTKNPTIKIEHAIFNDSLVSI
jgi:hypothetical protein